MRYVELAGITESDFRRLTGIKRATFEHMVSILQEAEIKKKWEGGKRNKLSMEDRLLMTLEYMREYRTYFHVSKGYGLSESACYRNIKWIENTLVRHPDFALPGRRTPLEGEVEIILVDATETPVERPKKNKRNGIQGRRKGTPSKHNCL